MKMKKFIVTTTINSPTTATKKFVEIAKRDGWTFVVVGDTKTPHLEYEELDCIYLSPEKQESLNKELSDSIGWKSIRRRNMGFLYAYQQGADVMASVDDDNIPYDSWGKELYVGKEIEIDLWESKNGYFDPLSPTNTSDLWHRGYPLSLVPTKNDIEYKGKVKRKVLVQADLWDGDPDIDAICRLSKMPCVKYNPISPYGSNQLSPFNSQNTFIAREAIPYYSMLPFIGRMDDIWAAYVLQKYFPNSVVYNKASVYQDRNPQDLIKNMEEEIIGYRNTLNLLEDLDNYENYLPKETKQSYKIYRSCF